MSGKAMRIGEFAARVNRSTRTVLRWEDAGLITPGRTSSGQRYFTEEHVRQALRIAEDAKRATIVYLRVSSPGQRSDLASQRQAMETWALNAGVAVDEWVEEVGSGLNFKRKKLLGIIDRAVQGEQIALVVAHADRLARFGFDLIEHVIELSDGKVIVVNQESLSPHEELVQDILAILHVFSSRLYGLRRYEKAVRDQSKKDGLEE